MRILLSFGVALFWVSMFGQAAIAQIQPSAAAQLFEKQICRHFQGVYRWDEPSAPQLVDMRVQKVLLLGGDRLEVTGTGRYAAVLGKGEYHLTNMEFRWRIDAGTFAVQMQEMNPDSEDFLTDGEYRGAISPDLRQIRTRWRTRGTQDSGTLVLQASKECGSGV